MIDKFDPITTDCTFKQVCVSFLQLLVDVMYLKDKMYIIWIGDLYTLTWLEGKGGGVAGTSPSSAVSYISSAGLSWRGGNFGLSKKKNTNISWQQCKIYFIDIFLKNSLAKIFISH